MSIRDPAFPSWLLRSMRSGLVAIDASGALVQCNADARRILGFAEAREDDLLGRDCREALAEQPPVVQLLLEALAGRERPSRAELFLGPTAEGRPRTIGFTVIAVRDDAGALAGAAMVFRDLTPFERCGEQDRLRERLAALGQMAAGLAHEIRNPLASMEVLAGLLKRRLVDQPEEQQLVAELTAEIHDLASTVSASLEFVRPPELSPGPTDPVELLEESLNLARSRVGFSGAIERAYDEAPPPLVADAEKLRAVVTNLIVNAFEAMAEVGREGHRLRLELSVRQVDRASQVLRLGPRLRAREGADRARSLQELVIGVADTGPGVPEHLREQIFYPFFTTKEGGSGVGLATAQKVVASHGGGIELEAAPGWGAIFQLRLPLRAAPPEGSS